MDTYTEDQLANEVENLKRQMDGEYDQRWAPVVPKRFMKATLEDLPPTLAEWKWPWKRGPLLFGPKGVGKTHAMAALVMHSKQFHPYHVVWVSEVQLFDLMRRKINDPTITLPKMDQARLMVIDDVGKARSTDWVREMMFMFVDDLYCRDAHIALTSNLHPKDLDRHLGEYTVDRLKEMTTCIQLEGESRRG